MKRLNLLIYTIFLMLLFISCDQLNDDDKPEAVISSIVNVENSSLAIVFSQPISENDLNKISLEFTKDNKTENKAISKNLSLDKKMVVLEFNNLNLNTGDSATLSVKYGEQTLSVKYGEQTKPYYLEYYKKANGLTGSALKSALNDIIDNHTELSYDEVYDALEVTDADPNNSSNVIEIYTGRSINGAAQYNNGKGWNREHVWAKSHGDFGTEKGPGTDLHHIRAADVSVNSSRGNKEFDEGGTPHSEATECKTDSDSWEPRDEVKGDIARMLFYMAVRYEGEHGEVDLKMSEDINDDNANPTHGKLSVLLKWNEEDPVSDEERKRNDIIYNQYQHNRNPFIDHPEYAKEIWAN